jgi:hypothetical protein
MTDDPKDDEILDPGKPDPEDGGGPDVPNDPVEEPEEKP